MFMKTIGLFDEIDPQAEGHFMKNMLTSIEHLITYAEYIIFVSCFVYIYPFYSGDFSHGGGNQELIKSEGLPWWAPEVIE